MSSSPSTVFFSRVRRGGDDRGLVLMVVIMSMIMVTAFVTAGLAYASTSQKLSRGDQDYNGSLAAAQAGIEDFIAQLNRNDNYARQSPFADCANTSMRGPAAPQPNTCGWTNTTATGWKAVDPGRVNGAEFHYDIDATELNAQGTIDVRSTGRVNGESRTLQVAVGRGGSTDFLYYTDHEDADPDNETIYPGGMHRDCANYWWGRAPDAQSSSNAPRRVHSDKSGTANDCAEITFIGGDEFDGKVHTNDTPLLTNNGSTKVLFKEGLQTADPACKASVRTDANSWRKCDRNQVGANYGTSWPQYASELYLKDNSAEFAAYPGCQYRGATRIKFASDGNMTVWSKDSTSLPASCGGNSPNGAEVAVPNDQVIYVRGGTSQRQCLSGEIGDGLPLGTYNGVQSQPSYTYDKNMLRSDARCGLGNVYVEGTVKGRVTVAAENSIIVTDDLTVHSLNSSDMLGLVAGNSVEVFHPVLRRHDCVGYWWNPCQWRNITGATYPNDAALKNLQIHASIQTLQHSFTVQAYDEGGNMGDLTVTGSIAQKWRGAVGRGSGSSMTGYLKDYRYDKRLKFSSPPYFPQFINAVWSGRTTGEIPAQYS